MHPLANKIIVFFYLTVVSYTVTARELTYWLDTAKDNPTSATISIDTSQLGEFVLEPSREVSSSANPSTLNIGCLTSEKSKTTIQFGKPIDCQSLQWQVQFKKLQNNQYNASSQQNIYSPEGWWLLFEWGNLPRIAGVKFASVCVAGNENICAKIPDKSGGPLLFAWGKNTATITTDRLNLKLFADSDILSHELPNISRQLEQQYTYLSQVFSHKQQQLNWSLIWTAIDQKYKTVSGAAGAGAYIANYLVDDGKLTNKTLPMLLRVSAHETIHGLSSYTFPAWINESLAEYYAFKAVQLSKVKTRVPVNEWQKNKHTFPHANAGLYEAQNMVVEQQDMSYYPLFYLKGAAFWQTLEQALQKSGKNLDTYIALLNNKADTNTISLSQPFIDAMIKAIGKETWQTIANQYL
ncbi:M1 family metallopeptidase [Spartinivicinus ruber]|uniref:M1 family metallopeptidase n=1 Tax=Spartinivicinus ruber TaxID=2683272 RepID=UPI0013D243DC|nr:M1 family metallopeptidase [Spartinivicinus ruber]